MGGGDGRGEKRKKSEMKEHVSKHVIERRPLHSLHNTAYNTLHTLHRLPSACLCVSAYSSPLAPHM
jgi:hypothetical protein